MKLVKRQGIKPDYGDLIKGKKVVNILELLKLRKIREQKMKGTFQREI